MSGDILRKAVNKVACEEWGCITGRVVSFCNLDVTEVAEFSSSVSASTLGAVTEVEKGSDINMKNNEM